MQLFTSSFSAHMQNIRTRNLKFLLWKSWESFDTEIMKKTKKVSIPTQKTSYKKRVLKLFYNPC